MLVRFLSSITISVSVLGVLVSAGPVLGQTREERPNVIFFAVDDLCDWVGAMGYEQAVTPNIDALSKAGVTFTNAHCPGTFCAPSRSAIFTGQYASTTGCYTTQVYFHDHPELRPLQVSFEQGGYAAYGGGKLFHHPAGYLDQRGWGEFFLRNEDKKKEGWPLDSWGEGTPIPQPFPNSVYNRGKKITGGLFLEWGAVPNEREEEMADTMRVKWACDVLKREHREPFFLAVGLYAPHFPNYAPQKYFDLYDPKQIKLPDYKADDLDDLPPKMRKIKTRRRAQHHEKLEKLGAVKDAIHGYLASVSYADAMLGRVVETLKSSVHRDHTVVVFWSDHGYHHGEKGDWGKHTLWERTTNVPFIWSGPGIAQDKKTDATVSLIDMYPTLVEACGLPPVKGLEGVSLAKTLAQPDNAEDRDVFVPYLTPGAYAVVNRDWRYIHYDDHTEELYNVRQDPNEWTNLAGDPSLKVVKEKLKVSAPSAFASPGMSNKERKLILEGETYRWEKKVRKR